MKNEKQLRRRIIADCQKAMRSTEVLYSIEAIASSLLGVYTASVLRNYADAIFQLDMQYGISNLWKLLLCVAASALLVPAIHMVGELQLFKNALRHDRYVFRAFFNKEYAKVQEIGEGEISYRLEMDPTQLRVKWIELVVNAVGILPAGIYWLYHTLQINVFFTLILLVCSAIQLMVPVLTQKLRKRYDKETRDYEQQQRAREMDILSNPHIVSLYGLARPLCQGLRELYEQYKRKVQKKNIRYTVTADQLGALLNTFSVLIILVLGAILTAHSWISIGSVAAMVMYYSVLNQIMNQAAQILKEVPAFKNLLERIEVLYSDEESTQGAVLTEFQSLEVQHLSFAYGEKTVLKNVSFSIHKGDTVCICGENGSGKSTLLKLLCGILKGYQGNVKVNGKELTEINLVEWRKLLAYAPQDPYMFGGSVRDNIRLGCLEAPEEEIDRIVKQLKMEDFVEHNSEGLSGGERQKVSIARALLKNTPVLLLDEPHSYLDRENLQWLEAYMKQSSKTIVYISHNEPMAAVAQQRVKI